MTKKDEEYLFNCMEQLAYIVLENNRMLIDLCSLANTYLANHSKENEEDFGRNVLANLISSLVDVQRLRKKGF